MDSLIRVVTNKADELARQWNKSKDPGIRDQWYKLLKTLPPISEDTHPIFRKKTK